MEFAKVHIIELPAIPLDRCAALNESFEALQQALRLEQQGLYADAAGKWPGLDARELAEWILAEGLPVRLGLQLHKFIWPADARGV